MSLAILATAAVATGRSGQPDAFASLYLAAVPVRGPAALLLFLFLVTVFPIWGLTELARAVSARLRHPILWGLIDGLVLAAAFSLLVFMVPYLGPVLSVPGYPIALHRFGDDRLAMIWLVTFAANAAAWALLGLLIGLGVALRRRRWRDAGGQRRAVHVGLMWVAGATVIAWLPFSGAAASARALLLSFDALPGVRYRSDLVYAEHDGQKLRLDLAVPLSPARPPLVMYVHGGGWHGGSRKEGLPWLADLTRAGFAAASVDYRLAPRYRWPAQLEDLRAACRWLRNHAGRGEYDSQRLAVIGWSAGGHLACMLALADPPADVSGAMRVRAAAALSPLTDLTAAYWDHVPSGAARLLGSSRTAAALRYRQASPITYVDRDDPPLLLLHGLADPVSPADQSLRLVRRAREVGGHAELLAVPGQRHRWFGWRLSFARRQVRGFLVQTLGVGDAARAD